MRTQNNKTKIIICRDCGKEVEVPKESKRILCDECVEKSHKNHFKNIVYQKILCHYPDCNNVIEIIPKKGSKAAPYRRLDKVCDECKEKNKNKKIEREIRCKKCGSLIRKEFVHDTYQVKPVIYEGLCVNCKPKIQRPANEKPKLPPKEKIIQKIKCPDCGKILGERGPGYFKYPIKNGQRCEECTQKRKEKVRKNLSERMKNSNPMKDEETAKKVGCTLQEKRLRGEIEYKKGSEHYLYKGNGIIRTVCKSRLYNTWIKPILERDNFKCTRCGNTKDLQVHHLRPFRDILRESMEELGISYDLRFDPIKNWDEDTLNKVVQKVLEKHKIEYGITLCKKCHEEIDYYYRPFKGKSKNED